MLKGATIGTAIQYFFLARGDKREARSGEKLVYYDERGVCCEKSISPAAMEEALRIFKGGVKAVRRSSGGLGSVEPYQLVLYEGMGDQGEREPKLRIRVRFKDFRRSEEGKILAPEYLVQSKVVSPTDIVEPFDYRIDGPQNFVMDFGEGIVPVHVFHYETDANGMTWAWFVEPADIELVNRTAPGERVDVQPYCAAREVLRFAAGSEFETAQTRYGELRRAYYRVIPEAVRLGYPSVLPSGLALEDAHTYLRRLCNAKTIAPNQPLLLSLQREDTADLLPAFTG